MTTGGWLLNRNITELVVRSRMALGLSQRKFGELLGASERTAARWDAGQSSLGVVNACKLAQHVYAVDPSLAAQLAAAANQSLESLGLVPPAAAQAAAAALPAPLIVDSVVCVAADALAVAPEAVRGALHAAFRRARELRLTLEDVEKALAPVAKKGKQAP